MSEPCMTKDELVRSGIRLSEELTAPEGPGMSCGRTELSRWGRLAVDQYRRNGSAAAKRALEAARSSPFGRGRGADYRKKVERAVHVLSECVDEVRERCGEGGAAAEALERIIGYAAWEMR